MGLLATSRAHTHRGLEAIIYPPLETGEGTNHQNTSTQSFRREADHTNLRSDLANRLALVGSLAELRNERISRVRDNGTDDTSKVARRECDSELGALAVGFLGLSEDVGVEKLDDLFEKEEFGHRVGDLEGGEFHILQD